MLRTTTLSTSVSATALLGLSLLAPTSAGAATETCQGQTATVVGVQDAVVEGTEGADVIVSNAATRVIALGGDDLICVTGISNPGVYAGEGDDVVVSTLGPDAFSTIVLGPGSDRFTGSSASDSVHAAGRRRTDPPDSDRDVIETGPTNGTYGDYVATGQPGVPNADEVRVAGGTSVRGGSASVVEFHGLPTPQTVLDGGGGSELTLETTDAYRVTIDTVADTYTRDEDTAAFTGFDNFVVTNEVETRYLTFRGSDRDESITMTTTRNSAYDIRMGDGDDDIAVETERIHRRVNVFAGGAGVDQLGIVMPRKQVRLDLRRNRLLAGKPRNAVPARAVAFEDAEIVADRIELVGTGGNNDLRANGCVVDVRALGGDDLVSPLTLLYDRLLRCASVRARFEGGAGNDKLAGDAGDDVLLGGPGRDVVNGGSGRDVCSGEQVKRCEVRR